MLLCSFQIIYYLIAHRYCSLSLCQLLLFLSLCLSFSLYLYIYLSIYILYQYLRRYVQCYVQVYRELAGNLPDCRFHILADTSYGSCCVDEIAALRLDTSAIIHFGHSCHSRILSLPTLFVYGKEYLDLPDLTTKVKQTFSFSDNILVMLNSIYYHQRNTFVKSMGEFRNLRCLEYRKEQNTTESLSDVEKVEFDEEYSILYVGEESLCLTNIVLTNGSRTVYSYDPNTKSIDMASRNVNKMLIKRFSFIEKIKKCKIIGILVGTLGIKNFNEVIDRMKKVIKATGKKYYVVSVGKPNPAKLANFSEIGAFVFVGCCENSLLDSRDYYQPVVTPYELELACIDRSWELDYISDCSSLLDKNFMEIPVVEEGLELVEKLDSLQVSVNFLNDRTWSGLEQRLGMDPPAVLQQGKSGIAGHYYGEEVIDSRMKNQ